MALPAITVREPRSTEDIRDEETLRWILINPIYAGVGPSEGQAYVTDEKWVRAQEKLIAEIGLESWLTNLLYVLRQTFHRERK